MGMKHPSRACGTGTGLVLARAVVRSPCMCSYTSSTSIRHTAACSWRASFATLIFASAGVLLARRCPPSAPTSINGTSQERQETIQATQNVRCPTM